MKSSREFRTFSGDPDPENVVNVVKEGMRARILKGVSQNETENQELRVILGKIDFDDWRAIYEEDARASGVRPEDMPFAGREDIFNIPAKDTPRERGQLGFHDSLSNTIGVSYHKLKKDAERLGVSVDLYVFSTLSHEQTHAVSRMDCVGAGQYFSQSGPELQVRSGYGETTLRRKDRSGGTRQFKGFDEGVTERYAREKIIFRYLEHHPELGTAAKVSRLREVLAEKQGYYDDEMKLVDALIHRISEISGSAPLAVWEAIIRGKYAGERLSDDATAQLFEEFFGPDFLAGLKSLEGNDDRTKLLISKLNGEVLADPRTLGRKLGSWIRKKLPGLR